MTALLAAAVVGLAGCSATSDSGDPSSAVSSDSGFKVESNGFSFANYGNEDGVVNLDEAMMHKLFGDQVCARVEGGSCTLYPTAQKWMRSINDSMDGGHCFGMAGLAWAMYQDAIDPQQYGGPDAAELPFQGNTNLQRELASVFATQFTQPTKSAVSVVSATEAVEMLEQGWAAGNGYVLALYRLVDGKQIDGHAITPVAVADEGNGVTTLSVYDNNFPDQVKRLEINTADDTWTYRTSSDPKDDPEVYKGGSNNELQLFPVSTMLAPQTCPFCDVANADDELEATAGSTEGETEGPLTAVFLNQQAGHHGVRLDVVGADGQPIPGASTYQPFTAGGTDPGVQFIPNETPFVVRIDATRMTRPQNADVTIMGQGAYWSADRIDMVPGAVEEIRFDPATATVSYLTEMGSSPDIAVGFDHPDASYRFLFGGLKLAKGGSLDVALDQQRGIVTAQVGGSGKSKVDFVMDRITANRDQEFTSRPIPLHENESIVIEYAKWRGPGSPVPIGIDMDGDGVIDEELVRGG